MGVLRRIRDFFEVEPDTEMYDNAFSDRNQGEANENETTISNTEGEADETTISNTEGEADENKVELEVTKEENGDEAAESNEDSKDSEQINTGENAEERRKVMIYCQKGWRLATEGWVKKAKAAGIDLKGLVPVIAIQAIVHSKKILIVDVDLSRLEKGEGLIDTLVKVNIKNGSAITLNDWRNYGDDSDKDFADIDTLVVKLEDGGTVNMQP